MHYRARMVSRARRRSDWRASVHQASLQQMGAPTGASDHGVSKSLYGRDPDGNEFEVMWSVPREAWGEYADQATVLPLDLEAELQRWGAGTAA